MTGSAPLAGSATASGRMEMVYAISAHQDDEASAWGLIANRPNTYMVFVAMTQGEGTMSCMRPAEVSPPHDAVTSSRSLTMVEGLVGEGEPDYEGAHKYQGPGSPVGQPDLGERRPYGNPWVGRQTEACKRARTASWHWFLDAMAQSDLSLPNFAIEDPWKSPTYRGRFCDRALRPTAPARRRNSGCASVWATESGARVAFDLGNVSAGTPESEHLTAAEVTKAI
ncbi:MAG TPA: hypothetical protein VNA12_03240, partial [Mycobacteriales bacterium]|nr:hypothetical protein [Mycobacteriales bacterium]